MVDRNHGWDVQSYGQPRTSLLGHLGLYVRDPDSRPLQHGGAAATIFDIVTSASLAPISSPGFWEYVGVSRTLNVTYLRPVRRRTKAVVTCEVLATGKRMATIRGVMHETKDGERAVGDVLCTCEHGKANIDPAPNKI